MTDKDLFLFSSLDVDRFLCFHLSSLQIIQDSAIYNRLVFSIISFVLPLKILINFFNDKQCKIISLSAMGDGMGLGGGVVVRMYPSYPPCALLCFSWKNDDGHAQFFCSSDKVPNGQEEYNSYFRHFTIGPFPANADHLSGEN